MTIEFTIRTQSGLEYKAFIDNIDADLLVNNWSIRRDKTNTYLRRTVRYKNQSILQLHRVILARALGRELGSADFVDHIDRNGLNNTRANLRLATKSQNSANRGAKRTNKTGLKGVYFRRGRYTARITKEGHTMYLGVFITPEEAHEAYKKASVILFGEFARSE